MATRADREGSVSVAGAVTACATAAVAAAELLAVRDFSDRELAVQLTALVLVCAPLALLPHRPASAVLLSSAATVVSALTIEPAQLLGTGMVVVIAAFAAARWLTQRSWSWAVPVVVATSLVRDLRDSDMTTGDVVADLGFLALGFGLGLAMRSRAVRVEQLEVDLADTEARMNEAVDVERTRLARELHDLVAHAVSVMVVQAGTSRPLADRESPELAEVLFTIETTGREALLELRRLLGVMRGEPLGLVDPVPRSADIPRMVERVRQAGLTVDLSLGELPHLSRGLDLCVYRVAQEGLTNALRHSPGSRVSVTVEAHDGAVTVAVTDDGSGRRPGPADVTGGGMGLIGLRERVSMFGGVLTADPRDGGFEVLAVLPLVAAQEPSLSSRGGVP